MASADVSVAPAADAAAGAPPSGAGKVGEGLRWRIDVEDYVSEDSASVVDSIMEELHGTKTDDAKAAGDQAAAPIVSSLGTAAAAAVPAPATATVTAASAAAAADAVEAPPAVPLERSMAPAASAVPVHPPMAAAPVATAFIPPADFSQLYSSLKEARERPARTPEEQARKAEEVAVLQAALKEHRARTTSITSTSITTAASAEQLKSAAFRAPFVGDGTTPMRRVASEGPVEGFSAGLYAAEGLSGYGALGMREYRDAEARSVAGYALEDRRSGPMELQRTQTTMTARARTRHGGDSYRGPPPGASARQAPLAKDPRLDPRQTLGFSEAQARAMGLIQGHPSAVNEASAEDVAHMQWKAGAMSRAPSVAGRSYAGSVHNGPFGDDAASVISDAPWEKRGGGARSVAAQSVYGDETNAIVPVTHAPGAPVTVSPWRSAGMIPVYKDQEIQTVDPIVDHSDAYSTISGAYFRAPPQRAMAPSEAGDFTMSLSLRHSEGSLAPKSANKTLSRRLGQLTLLGDEGVTMPDVPEVADDAKSVKSVSMAVTLAAQPPPQQPEGRLDLQLFNRVVREMREEGEQIQKLKQQNKLLQGWYQDSKAWADEKSLRAWEAMSIADDAEDIAAMKHKMLKELDVKLQALKERMAGYSMLEQENRMLRQKIQLMTNTKAPDSILQSIKSGPRGDIVSALLAGSQKNAKQDLEMLQDWMEELQEDGGQVEHLKKLNRLLQGWYADANSRAEDSVAREREEFKRAKEAEELAAAGDLLLLEMEAKHSEMRMKLAARQMLEQENRELRSKIIALSSSRGPNVPVQKQQAVLLEFCRENMGFSKGRPVMACLVYKAMVHWSMIEVERLNTFDAVMELQDQACKQANPDVHCYWLSNAVHMLFLTTRGPTRIDSAVAKTQLAAKTERLFVTIRDNVKGQLTSILNTLLQPPPVPMDDSMSEVGSVVSGANTTVLHKLVPSAGNVRRQCTMMWENVIGALRQLVDVLRANYVPPLIVRELLGQLLQFVDFKLFNNIMMHSPWVPCTLTNGETLDAGLADLEDWLVNVDEWLNSTLMDTISLTSSSLESVKHLKQATVFLLDPNKAKRSLRSIQKLCPDLSMTQLAHICTWFEDDKDGLPGVEPAVIEQMWALMHEDQPFLLKEDKGCPFTGDEVARSMREFTMDDIEPPQELKKEAAFHFLIPAGISPPDINPEPVPGVNESNVAIVR